MTLRTCSWLPDLSKTSVSFAQRARRLRRIKLVFKHHLHRPPRRCYHRGLRAQQHPYRLTTCATRRPEYDDRALALLLAAVALAFDCVRFRWRQERSGSCRDQVQHFFATNKAPSACPMLSIGVYRSSCMNLAVSCIEDERCGRVAEDCCWMCIPGNTEKAIASDTSVVTAAARNNLARAPASA